MTDSVGNQQPVFSVSLGFTQCVWVSLSVVSNSLQPMNCSPPDSSVHGNLQAYYWSGLPCPSLPSSFLHMPMFKKKKKLAIITEFIASKSCASLHQTKCHVLFKITKQRKTLSPYSQGRANSSWNAFIYCNPSIIMWAKKVVFPVTLNIKCLWKDVYGCQLAKV